MAGDIDILIIFSKDHRTNPYIYEYLSQGQRDQRPGINISKAQHTTDLSIVVFLTARVSTLRYLDINIYVHTTMTKRMNA